MPIPTYVSGFPQDGQTLGNSKAQIRSNLDGTFQTVAINHFNNNSANAGKHNFLQIPQSTSTPASTAASELLLYNRLQGGLNNLYFVPPSLAVSGANSIQMTRNEIPTNTGGNSPGSSGFTWLPGSYLLQWGYSAINSGVDVKTTITFPIAFSGANKVLSFSFALQTGHTGSNVTPQNIYVVSNTATNFVVTNTATGTGITNAYWMVIGF